MRLRTPLLLLTASLLVALAGAAPSFAATPKGNALYGGGYLGPKAPEGEMQLAAAKTSGNGRSVSFYANYYLSKCALTFNSTRKARVLANGKFRSKGKFKEQAGTSTIEGEFEFEGKFVRPDKAVGTYRVQLTDKSSTGTQSCDTGKVPFTIVAPTASLGSGQAKGGDFYGYTSQKSTRAPVNMPAVLRVAPGGQVVSLFFAFTNNFCTADPETTMASNQHWTDRPMPITGGQFSDTSSYDLPWGDDSTATYTYTITGTFGKRSVTGTWEMSVVVKRKSDGAQTDTCSSGKLTWQAAR